MKQTPHVRFQLNKELDIKMCNEFLYVKGGGIDFGLVLVRLYRNLADIKEEKNEELRLKLITEFIDGYYKRNIAVFNEILKVAENSWYEVEDEFFTAVTKLFGDYKWPKGEYTGYISMLNSNPRFLNNKTFQCFYKKVMDGRSNSTIAHEMLHFIFFDYLENVKIDFKKKYSNEEIWRLSEAFNEVVQTFSYFKNFGNSKNSKGYPEIETLVYKLREQVPENKFTLANFFEISATLPELKII